jgi:hypothetical protein
VPCHHPCGRCGGQSQLIEADEKGSLDGLRCSTPSSSLRGSAPSQPHRQDQRSRSLGRVPWIGRAALCERCQHGESERGVRAAGRIEFRIGIPAEDILKANEIFGQRVNTAARVAPSAEPGRICISVRCGPRFHGGRTNGRFRRNPCRLTVAGRRSGIHPQQTSDQLPPSTLLGHSDQATEWLVLAERRTAAFGSWHARADIHVRAGQWPHSTPRGIRCTWGDWPLATQSVVRPTGGGPQSHRRIMRRRALTIVQSVGVALVSTAWADRPAATSGRTPISRPGRAAGSSRSARRSPRRREPMAARNRTRFRAG